jgi:hypothetical protein
MRFRLRTLVILTAVGPPMLWGIFSLLRLPGVFYWSVLSVAALAICTPMIILKLWLAVNKK